MKKQPIITILFLLILSAGCTQAQNTMKIPLAEGYENPPIHIDGATVEVIRLGIQEKPYSDRSVTAFVQLNITENNAEYSTYLNYWDINTGGLKEDYPKAFGKHLFGLEVNNSDTQTKPQVALTIEQNDFGKPFFLDLEQETVIGNLTVRLDETTDETALYHGSEQEVSDTYIRFTLSENNEQETFSFMANKLDEKGSLSFEWKDYRIWILDYPETSVQLKIEKQ